MKYLVTLFALAIISLPLHAADYYSADGDGANVQLKDAEVAAIVNPTWKLRNNKMVLLNTSENAQRQVDHQQHLAKRAAREVRKAEKKLAKIKISKINSANSIADIKALLLKLAAQGVIDIDDDE